MSKEEVTAPELRNASTLAFIRLRARKITSICERLWGCHIDAACNVRFLANVQPLTKLVDSIEVLHYLCPLSSTHWRKSWGYWSFGVRPSWNGFSESRGHLRITKMMIFYYVNLYSVACRFNWLFKKQYYGRIFIARLLESLIVDRVILIG